MEFLLLYVLNLYSTNMKKQRPLTTGDIRSKQSLYYDNGTKKSESIETLFLANNFETKETYHNAITG